MSQALISLTALALHKGFAGVLLYLAQHRAQFSFLTATLLGEAAKLIFSFLALQWTKRSAPASYVEVDTEEKIGRYSNEGSESEDEGDKEVDEVEQTGLSYRLTKTERRKTLVLLGVACLYVLQNNLYLNASMLLRPTILQVVWQLRILTTALASAVLLRRHFSNRQMCGLVGLLVSVILIDSGLREDKTAKSDTALDSFNYTIGILSAIGAAIISGFAGVLAEVVLKDASTNLWSVNVQMSLYSLVPSAIFVATEMSIAKSYPDKVSGLDGFSSVWAWSTVFVHGLAGLLVAFATKFASSVSKSFSGAFAILVTFVLSVAVGTRPADIPIDERLFYLVSGNVVLFVSTYLYAFGGTATGSR